MSVDTDNKRSSAVNVGSPWRGMLPFPDGAISRSDRSHVAFMYEQLIVSITSTHVLDKPVDYALAGDQDQGRGIRAGRAAGRGLRHTFGE